MRRFRNIAGRVWDKLLVTCGVLYVLFPTSPLNMPLATRDSGVFLYIGWRILHGEVPYRDIWDHKPPVIFYIDALGLAIANNSRWGVWLVEFVSLFLAAFIGFHLVKKALGTFPAIFSTLLWLMTLIFVIQGGNFTTEYTLPLQFAALWLVVDPDRPDISNWRYFLIGLIGAIAFLTKQTSIGVWIAIVLYLTIRDLKSGQVRRWLRNLFLLSIGGFVPMIGTVIFFGIQGALPQFWSAAFKFNFVYSSSVTGFMDRLSPLIFGIKPLTLTGMLQFSVIGYAIAIILVLFIKNTPGKWLPLWSIGLIDLPTELILVSSAGLSYPHYFIALLPALSLFAGLMFWVLFSQVSTWSLPNAAKYIFMVSVVGLFLWASYFDYRNQVIALNNVRDETVINYLRSATTPDDSVLLWGAEASVNYYAQRRSPSRFVYQYPLYKKGYVNKQMIVEFLEDIIQNRPRLIIDTMNPSTPIYDFPIQTKAIEARITFLKSHYRLAGTVGSWTVYEWIE